MSEAPQKGIRRANGPIRHSEIASRFLLLCSAFHRCTIAYNSSYRFRMNPKVNAEKRRKCGESCDSTVLSIGRHDKRIYNHAR